MLAITLAEGHPAWLLALNSTNRILGLTTNQLDPVSYYLIGSLRLLGASMLMDRRRGRGDLEAVKDLDEELGAGTDRDGDDG